MRARGLRSPWAGTVVTIDLRLPTGPLTTSTTRLPPLPPLPAHTPPPAPGPAPKRPGGRTARWAERIRRRPLGPACLRRSERVSRLRGSACSARLAPPACRRARSSRGRHAPERAGTAPSCRRPAGLPGPSCCARPAPCSCATPMRRGRLLALGKFNRLISSRPPLRNTCAGSAPPGPKNPCPPLEKRPPQPRIFSKELFPNLAGISSGEIAALFERFDERTPRAHATRRPQGGAAGGGGRARP